MKPSPRSHHLRHLRQLLGLALIGFVLWLAAIGWLAVRPANAAPDGPHHGHAPKRLARMPTQLNLPPGQIARLGPILSGGAAQHQRLREKNRRQDRRAMRTERQALREETDAALAAVLTADQPAAWQKRR